MKINYMLDEGAFAPSQGHSADAGYDLKVPAHMCGFVKPRDSAIVDTGVHFEIPEGYVGFIKSKSGLNVKHGLICEGVIDSGYTGSIVVKLYNLSDEPYFINGGDKLTQIVFLPIPKIEFEQVDTFADTERGDNGFGSTGK